MDPILAFLAGVAIGAVVLWISLRQQARRAFEGGRASMDAGQAALIERLAASDRDVARLRADVADAATRLQLTTAQLREEVERRSAVQQAASRVPQLEAELRDALQAAKLRDEASAAINAENAGLRAQLDAERATTRDKLAVLDAAQEQLTSAFRGLSAQALRANNESFLDLAKQTLAQYQQGAQGELERRQQAIQELVAPVKLSLEKLDGRIVDIERLREGAYQGLMSQVRSLSEGQGDLRRETLNLVKALRQPAARGRWGELQLRRVVEMAGMVEYCDFVEQVSAAGEDGRQRPDVVIRLPGGLNIVVDAKTPLSAYLEAAETDDDDVRRARLGDHARQVRDHMTRLGRKSYQAQFEPSPDLVVLFLPGEMLFSAALQHDPGLIEFGAGEKVMLATPTTFIALLRTVAYGWKQEALARNAQEISELGRQLHDRISVMAAHWAKVGKNLGEAVGAYNGAVASLETRVLVSARRFKELKAVTDGREIAALEPIDVTPRALQIADPELLRGAGSVRMHVATAQND
jgi:DNA recombination protein RmuC